MIDSKKLALAPLTEYEIGSNMFCLVVMCRYDNGQAVKEMCQLLNVNDTRIHRSIKKGRLIRDEMIRQEGLKMMAEIQNGVISAPRIARTIGEQIRDQLEPGVTRDLARPRVPEVRVVAVSHMCPPRGLVPVRQHEPIKATHQAPTSLQ